MRLYGRPVLWKTGAMEDGRRSPNATGRGLCKPREHHDLVVSRTADHFDQDDGGQTDRRVHNDGPPLLKTEYLQGTQTIKRTPWRTARLAQEVLLMSL